MVATLIPLTLAQLRSPVTQEEAFNSILERMGDVALDPLSWQDGGIARSIVEAMSFITADQSQTVANMTLLPYVGTSEGDSLTELSKSHFDNDRKVAIRTVGQIRLTDIGSVGPVTINLSELVVGTAGDEFTFTNTTSDTVPLDGSVFLTVQADVAGADSNVSNGQIVKLVTTISGIQVDNIDNATGSSTWRTGEGADAESDATLRTRDIARWGTLNEIAMVGDGYVFLALSVDGVERALVDTPVSPPGSVDVYIAGATGTSSAGDVTAVNDILQVKKPPESLVTTIAATALPQDISGVINVDATIQQGGTGTVTDAVTAAINDLINGLPIGGLIIPPAIAGVLAFSELIGAITSVEGVISVTLTNPLTDVPISTFEVMTVGSLAGLLYTPV